MNPSGVVLDISWWNKAGTRLQYGWRRSLHDCTTVAMTTYVEGDICGVNNVEYGRLGSGVWEFRVTSCGLWENGGHKCGIWEIGVNKWELWKIRGTKCGIWENGDKKYGGDYMSVSHAPAVRVNYIQLLFEYGTSRELAAVWPLPKSVISSTCTAHKKNIVILHSQPFHTILWYILIYLISE